MRNSADSVAASRQRLYRGADQYREPTAVERKYLAFMISASGVRKGDRVLDLACGTGSATLAFAEHCRTAVGVDVVSEPLVDASLAATRRGIANAGFLVSEVECIPFAKGTFSGAISYFSFEHFTHPERVFAEMARVVATGGWMLISDIVSSEDAAKAAFHTGSSDYATRLMCDCCRLRNSSGCSPRADVES